MKFLKLVVGTVSMAVLTTACSKTGSSPDSSVAATAAAAGACTNPGAVDTTGLKIVGSTVAQVGQPVSYQLSKNLDCSTSQNVNWQNQNSFAQSTQKSSSVLSTTYSQPGTYVVSATVASVSPSGGSQRAAASALSTVPTLQVAQRTTVVGSAPAINAAQISILGYAVSFQLVVPSGAVANNVLWNLDDGATAVPNSASVSHTYFSQGLFNISVSYTDANGAAVRLAQPLNIVQYYDGLDCITDASISSPSEAYAGASVAISSYTPACLMPYVQTIAWNLGDGSSDSGASIHHTYPNVGSDIITSSVNLQLPDGTNQTLTLSQPISIINAPVATPSPTPVATATPAPTATPTPTPSPTPVDPNACGNVGQTKDSYGSPYSQQATCGLDGHKTQTYALKTTYACQMKGSSLSWNQVSQTPVLQSEGACTGQSCPLPDGTKLTDGQTQTGVTIGTVQVAVACPFNEAGISSTYNQIEDKTCGNGALTIGNVRNGSLISAGVCPTYAWTATGTFGACSANCGGQQSMIYACVDSHGAAAPNDHCPSAPPQQTQACDGNPAAVARTDVTTSDEDANSSTQSCPKNQIGVIVNERVNTTTTVYACVDHAVKASVTVSNGAWVSEPYCRPYTAYRCSQDSLDETKGLHRYQWMVKCEAQDPILKEFLDNFSGVTAAGGYTDQTDGQKRSLYPTFMQVVNGKEIPWIAPITSTASCTLPSGVYIAAVCLSGCATPEQELVTQAKSNMKMKYTSFLTALTENHPAIGTLPDDATISTSKLTSTPVDQWVTDMIDTDHAVREFHMRSGGSLRVTTNHTLIIPDGSIVTADQLKVGDRLVLAGGKSDEIMKIDDATYYGKVYNVFVKSSSPQRNIMVTNGYLNGTDFYQNEGVSHLNRVILRQGLVGRSLK